VLLPGALPCLAWQAEASNDQAVQHNADGLRMKWSVICGADSKADATRIVAAVSTKGAGETGSLVQNRRTPGGLALIQHLRSVAW
jgi:hypothetical protein